MKSLFGFLLLLSGLFLAIYDKWLKDNLAIRFDIY